MRIFFCHLFLLVAGWAIAVPHPAGNALLSSADSIQAQWTHDTPDSQKVSLLIDLAESTMDQDHGQAKVIAERALQIAQKSQDSASLLKAHLSLGSLEIAFNHNYQAATQHLTRSLELSQGLEKQDGEFTSLQYLAYIQFRMENYGQAMEYYLQALEMALQNGWRDREINIRLRMGELLVLKGEEEQGYAHYEAVAELEGQDDFAQSHPETMASIAFYYEKIGRWEEALDLFQRAVDKFTPMGTYPWISYLWGKIGVVQYNLGQTETALESIHKGLDLAEEHQLTKEMVDNHTKLAVIYDSLGYHKEALYHFREQTRIEKEVFSVERATQIASIQSEYELSLKERDLEQVQVENELQKRRIKLIYMGSGLVILLLGILALVVFRGYRQKQRVNDQLEGRVELKDLALSDVVRKLRHEVDQHESTRKKLESSNSELNHFIYKSSHDLRGPLASIIGLVSLAETESAEAERLRYLDFIRASSTRISQKLDALLHATRLKEKALDLRTIHLPTLVKTCIKRVHALQSESGVEIKSAIPEDLHVRGDEELLDSLIGNLVENGVKFRDAGQAQAWVQVSAEVKGERLLLEVADNGQGIPDSQKGLVFEMFVRSDYKQSGSGLGLYLVQKIVEKLDGSLRLESEAGQGTVIQVELPLA